MQNKKTVGEKVQGWRNSKTVRLVVIALLMLVVAVLYFRNVNTSNLTTVDGVKAEMGANFKPDSLEKKVLLGGFAVLGAALGLEASNVDFDLKKLIDTKGDFKASKVMRDTEGNVVTQEQIDKGLVKKENAKFTDEYDCKDFATQPKAQKFFEDAGGIKGDTNRLDGNKDGTACQALPVK
jgi:Excalibur calcium-binding domain